MTMSDLREKEFNSLKILHHIDRLKALAEEKDIAPVTVEIDPVAYCNHHCEWCVDPIHAPVKMSLGTFESLITELAEFSVDGFRVKGIVFKGGGEPTLHPQFGAMVERIASLGFAIGLVTNGSRLVNWAEVLANHASYVRVSIDGPTPESHAHVHKSKDFQKIIDGTKQLIAHRNDKRYPIVGLSFAIDIHTVDLAEQAIQLGEDLGVNYILMRPPFFEEVGSKPTMSIEEAQQVRKKLKEAAENYNGTMDVLVGNWVGDVEQKAMKKSSLEASGRRALHLNNNLPIEHRTGRCLASPVLAVITADGNLYGCCNLRALPKWSFGQLDYATGIGFSELWKSKQRQQTLQKMHNTECIKHCTHPLSRYNEMIEVLRNKDKPHSEFV